MKNGGDPPVLKKGKGFLTLMERRDLLGAPPSGFSGVKDGNSSDVNQTVFAQALLASHPGLLAPGLPLFSTAQPDENVEKQRIAGRLQGFNPKDNPVWTAITQKFGPNIKQPELLSIATVLATNTNTRLDRDAKRRKSVLLKWFEENWAAIAPFIDFVVLEDSRQV
jgi:hypothetical protein